jgi:transposase
VALAAFPKGNRYVRMRDELGEIYTDELFAEAVRGRMDWKYGLGL